MREREDQVMIGTGKEPVFPSIKPLLFGQPTALWARAMSAGVVGNLLEVTFRTTVDVSSKFTSPTVADCPRSSRHVTTDAVLRSEAGVVLLE